MGCRDGNRHNRIVERGEMVRESVGDTQWMEPGGDNKFGNSNLTQSEIGMATEGERREGESQREIQRGTNEGRTVSL